MFKKFSVLIIGLIFLGITLTITSVFMITKSNWERYYDSFAEHTDRQITVYLDNLIEDMTFAIESHAYWSEAIEYLYEEDEEWLNENATEYIVDMGLFSTDYILVANEELTFVQESGDDIQEALLNDERVLSTLKEDKVNVFYKNINNQDAIVVSSPFLDNNLENPTGLYLCLTFLNDQKTEELFSMMPGELKEVTIEAFEDTPVAKGVSNEIIIKKEIVNSDKYLVLRFYVEEMYRMFYLQRNQTFLIILFSGSSVAFTIVLIIYKITKRLKQLTYTIKEISEGDYDNEVSVKGNDYLSELNELTTAVNKMAGDIRVHVQTIDANYNEMVDVIINAVEINDAYTSRHNIEVGKYAKIIAEEINYEHIEDLVVASKLHDIGKISIPSNILNKPGKLTEDEYEIIKIHPLKGYQIIEHLDYFKQIKLGVKYHHEKFDGSGYPEGLKANEIPLIAQIISIADVYDAITSDRSYRKGLSHDQTIQIIKEGSGTMFDPKLVEAFLRRTTDFNLIRLEYRTRNN